MAAFHVAVATAIIYAQIVTAFNASEHEALKVQINDAKVAKEFSTLLNSIVNVNKERYDTLKKMARLQQFPSYPPKQALRAGETDDSSEDENENDDRGPKIVAYLVLPQQGQEDSESDSEDDTFGFAPYRPTEGLNGSIMSADEEEVTLRADEDENTLRSCHRRGYKKCKRACKSALREACNEYTCKKRFRKKFMRECKRSCKIFGGGRDSDSDY